MRFESVPADRVAAEIADWLMARPAVTRFGVDGDESWGSVDLADAVAAELRAAGRAAVRASTRWWLRAASLRLEFGRENEDSLPTGWWDAAALDRELLSPIRRPGMPFRRRLRDPETDRSVREQAEPAPPDAVLLLDGPFLADLGLELDATVALLVSPATVLRRLPVERQWWAGPLTRYLAGSARRAEILLSYDHPDAPAVSFDA